MLGRFVRMRVLLAVLLVTFALPAAASAATPCGPADATTVAQGALTRVFVAGAGYRACTDGTRGSVVVRSQGACRAPGGCDGGSDAVRVAGRLVALAGSSADGRFTRVETFDARTGRWAAPPYGSEVTTTERRAVAAVALAEDGRLALAIRHDAGSRPAGVEVRRSAGCGRETLDDGPDVDPASVRLQGQRIVWTRGGIEHHARACPTVALARRVCPAARASDVWAISGRVVALEAGLNGSYRFRLCGGDRRRRTPFVTDGVFDDLLDVTAGGTWVAWWTRSCKGGCTDAVGAMDLRTGRRLSRVPAASLDPGTLRIARGRIRWTAGGEPRTARLPAT